MAVSINELKKLLADVFSNAEIEVLDSMGDGHHMEAIIISDEFQGKSNIERHKMVYDSLGTLVGNEIHALTLTTKTFAEKTSSTVNSTNTSKKQFNTNDDALQKIDNFIKNNKVVLFMKGTKNSPMCGFSSHISAILSSLQVDFVDVDVIADSSLREKIKEYSSWPTIPQLYINGEFIGGCDIISSMFQTQQLQTLLKEQNIKFTQNNANS